MSLGYVQESVDRLRNAGVISHLHRLVVNIYANLMGKSQGRLRFSMYTTRLQQVSTLMLIELVKVLVLLHVRSSETTKFLTPIKGSIKAEFSRRIEALKLSKTGNLPDKGRGAEQVAVA